MQACWPCCWLVSCLSAATAPYLVCDSCTLLEPLAVRVQGTTAHRAQYVAAAPVRACCSTATGACAFTNHGAAGLQVQPASFVLGSLPLELTLVSHPSSAGQQAVIVHIIDPAAQQVVQALLVSVQATLPPVSK